MPRVVPERSGVVHILVTMGGFVLGPLAAIWLSAGLAPESEVVQAVAPFAFAGVFAGGVLFWMGFGVAVVVVKAVWSLLRGRRPGPAGAGVDDRLVPPGYRAFPVLGVLAGLGVGLLSTLLGAAPAATSFGAWVGFGLAYGGALWLAAHHGYMPFPEPE